VVGEGVQVPRPLGEPRSQWTADLPRPILSMHVRQGNKGRETEILPFPRYMQAAEDLRRRTALRHAWLPAGLPGGSQEGGPLRSAYCRGRPRAAASATLSSLPSG